MGSSSPLSPTFYGHIASTQDALILFEACLSGTVNHVARRPHDRERSSLIKSGNVFIYEEHSSGIKRWTDGVPWSPSRILGNFLVYRELERPFPPGEKKRAMKRAKQSTDVSKNPDVYDGLRLNNGYGITKSSFEGNGSLSKETERSLIGSLVDSYGFKEDGLVKKTVSVTVGGVSHHLVSYYTVADVMSNKFSTPSKNPRFQHIVPRPDLITKQNFRTPIDEVDNIDRLDDRSAYSSFAFSRNSYDMTNQSVSSHRPLSLPTPAPYAQGQSIFPNYGMSTSPGGYGEGYGVSNGTTGYVGQYVSPVGMYPTTKVENQVQYAQRHPRYSPTGTSPPDGRSPISAGLPLYSSRRMSSFGQSHSVDSTSSADSKISNDSGYASQGQYFGHRDMSNPPQHNYNRKMSLPTPTLPNSYDRQNIQPYPISENPSKANVWPMGNVNNGHSGHYLSPQSQHHWASTTS